MQEPAGIRSRIGHAESPSVRIINDGKLRAMGARPNWRAIGFDMRAAESTARDVEQRQCAAAMDAWNERTHVRRDPDPSPSIGVAIAAGHRWLQVYCPGCRQVKEVDLVAVDRHPAASLSSLIPALSCTSCPGGAPFARILGATKFRQPPKWKTLPL